MWLILSIFSAFVLGGKRVYEKYLTGIFGNFAMGFIIQAFSVVPTIVLLFVLPHALEIGTLPWRFWWPLIIIWLVLYPIQTYFFYRATREGDISTVVPVMALLPVFNVVSSYVVLHEAPSSLGLVGIAAIAFATYLMLWRKKSAGGISKPVLLMISAVVCIAIGSTLDKVSIGASNPVFYSLMNTLGASIVFFILMHVYNEKHSFGKMSKFFWQFTFLGVLQALSYTAAMYGFASGPTSYVLAIRAGGYILAAIWGLLVLKESFSFRKGFAFACFVLGVVLLALA